MKTSKTISFSPADVAHIAKLANIPVSSDEIMKFSDGFTTTIGVVNQLFSVDVQGVLPIGNVTGLENIFRNDEIDEKRMLTQPQALSNAKRTYKGFFVVRQVIEK